MHNGVILMTGAAGFLGSQVARNIFNETDCSIVALVRGRSQKEAEHKLRRAWWDWPELAGGIGTRVTVLNGDVSKADLGIDKADYEKLIKDVDYIIHSAALLRFDLSIDEIRKTNVQGVAHMLELARAINKDHGLKRFAHISTAYVAGSRTGPVPENALTADYGFINTYEQTKYEGEMLIRAAQAELPISVFRPGMVIGDSRNGEIKIFNVVYFALRLYMTGKIRFFTARPDLPVNLVPVDYVAEAISRLMFNEEAAGLTFHLTAPKSMLPRSKEMVDFIRQWARDNCNLKLPPVLFTHTSSETAAKIYTAEQKLLRKDGKNLNSLLTVLPYFNEQREFLRDNVDRLMGPYRLNWRDFMPKILEYSVYMSYMHRYDRTVFEQVMYRLGSKSRQVTLHDIIDNKIVSRKGGEVRQDVFKAIATLRALGVNQGDRVALVGLNSTRYLTLNLAMGLMGVVSVPLYYTSPPSELEEIIKSCQAKLFFIGAPKILERVGELTTDIPVISYCREPVPVGLPRQVKSWNEFLALGGEKGDSTPALVSFGDIATLIYTSGTTAKPKGAIYTQEKLLWMSEAMASLMPWKERNNYASYLSYLPMNHVVEGLLTAYTPYYLPARLDIYYLEDFKNLQEALPLVRPTIFFSVPRFYEKVLEALYENKLGKYYTTCKEGVKKRLLGLALGKVILKKAGLDKCAFMLAGSAPLSEEILTVFHDLGIEIYNGYGLTEAPLVTLNRLGSNHLGTVGEPLPHTKVRIASDGEVLVKGSQVTVGYSNTQNEQPFEDGWLQTGDLGYLNKEGKLVIHGRKKEMIITSYAKKIHPAKVENLLKQIPGITEAVIVGDGKPFCSALLWVEGNLNGNAASIDHAIETVNLSLAHPEQVKRWAILPNDLSIEQGDLTATLKLKRRAINGRFGKVIESFYEGDLSGDTVLHFGKSSKG